MGWNPLKDIAKVFDRAAGTNISGRNSDAKFLGIGNWSDPESIAKGAVKGALNTVSGGLTQKLGLFNKGDTYNPGSVDFQPISSRWNNITEGFTSEGLPTAINQQTQQSNTGINTGLNTLQQFGGSSVGAADRMNRASKWGNAMGESTANQDALLSKYQTKQQGIMGIDLPIAQGREQAIAQANAASARSGASGLGTLGTIVGGIGGAFIGGPTGAIIGANIGGGLGTNLGSNNARRYG
jgi:hypothetical protein